MLRPATEQESTQKSSSPVSLLFMNRTLELFELMHSLDQLKFMPTLLESMVMGI
jgi:hypothetical protein